MSWFDDLKTPRIKSPAAADKPSKVPEGLWTKCDSCGEILQTKNLRENLRVCPICGHHFVMGLKERIEMLIDAGTFVPFGENLESTDPLKFDDQKPYVERLKTMKASLGMRDAFVAGRAELGGLPFCLGVFQFKFMGGSMGVVVGEKVALLFEESLKLKIPAVIVSSSGGARMQEGILSLMQMAKTCALVEKMNQARIPYISVLTHPTTGGVAASFAMLGDIHLAEPAALIGFAGPRVIQQTLRQELPPGAQRSEFLMKHGFVDRVVHRKDLGKELKSWMWRLGRGSCRFPKQYRTF